MIEEETSDRVQSIYTSLIKNLIGQIHDRYISEDYSSSDLMFDCALVMIKEVSQIAVLLNVPRETYLSTCAEIFDVVKLTVTDVAGTA